MSRIPQRRLVLDPGLTAITLRALHVPGGHYPFLDPARRSRARRWRPGLARLLGRALTAHRTVDRSTRPSSSTAGGGRT